MLGLEVGARIHHASIEPHAVEGVGDIVVMLDVGLVAAVLVPPSAETGENRFLSMRHVADERFSDPENAPCTSAEVHVAMHIGTGQFSKLRRRKSLEPVPSPGVDIHLVLR